MNYFINENLAKEAKSVNSFSEYQEGSATASYTRLCEEFKNEMEQLVKDHPKNATPEVLELCDYYFDKYQKKLAEAKNRENRIEASCPSIMISGAGNFPIRKKEKQNKARENFWNECGELFKPTTCYYFQKIKIALTNSVIYSSDDCVLEKLMNKLDEAKKIHEVHIKANEYYRKNKTMKGFENLTDEEAKKIDEQIENAYAWEKQPFPSYELAGETNEMRRLEKRMKEIEKMKERAKDKSENKYESVDGITVEENAEAMRIQLFFDGKPSEEIRSILKSHGFRWSPKSMAWQRQLSQNGIYATKEVLELIKKY